MPSPIDVLLDQVDWKCTKCGISAKIGCACRDRTTAEEKKAVATAVRKWFQVVLRTEYRPLYDNRSARVNLPNHLANMVDSVLRALDREAPRGYGVLAEEIPRLVAAIRMRWEAYVLWMFRDEWAALGGQIQGALVQAVDQIVREELGRLVPAALRVAHTDVC